MKILQCHNYYQQAGGENQVFSDERFLLKMRGHTVFTYTRHNDEINKLGRLQLACRAIWNSQTYEELSAQIERQRPDVMHCTNIFPLISPAAYDAAFDAGVPVVQSLHNYRLLCPNALFLRDGRSCEDCLGKTVAWPAVVHSCYRDSRSASAVVAGLQVYQRARRTWHERVDRFIALSEFSRGKFVEGGVPESRIQVKPNFMHDVPASTTVRKDQAVFVGRLSSEKGINVLLSAWSHMQSNLQLLIVGEGPLNEMVSASAQRDKRIEWIGRKSREAVLDIIGNAVCTVLPSICYENCPQTVVESFSRGTPVVLPSLGAMVELIRHGQNGIQFESGNPVDLARNIDHAVTTGAFEHMRSAARLEFEKRFTADVNYRQLMTVYQEAINSRRSRIAETLTVSGRA